MPAAVVGAASIWGGTTAFSAAAGWTLANVAAGAMIVGGVMSVYGSATGDKEMANNGMIISGIGSLGVSALGSESARMAAMAEGEAATQAAASSGTPWEALSTGETAAQTTTAIPGSAPTNMAGIGGSAGQPIEQQMMKMQDRYSAMMDKVMAQNTQAQVIGTMGQSASGYLQAREQEKTAEKQMEEQRRIQQETLARRSNKGITLPSVQLPKLKLTRPGLIGIGA